MRSWFARSTVAALSDRKGISSLEYAILAAAILGVVGTAAQVLGGDVSQLFGKVETVMTNLL
jgi:Flp pilus assembly pilin Flp